MPAIVLLAGQSDLRVSLFQAALQKAALPPATLISYEQLAAVPEGLPVGLSNLQENTLLRIDSSGRDRQALRVILEKGAEVLQAKGQCYWSKQIIASALAEKGRLVPSHQYHQGLAALLQGLKTQLDNQLSTQLDTPCSPLPIAALSYMNPIDDSLLMNDKAACHAYLHRYHIPLAPALATPDTPVMDYEDLRQRIQQQGMHRVFVKLRHGAGAAGIVALETSGHRVQARTTVECVDTATGLVLYNSRQIRKITREPAIKVLIDQLCRMDVHVERWIPKAQVGGHSVDCRILVIGGEVCHQVLRMSRSPITNLHLLNQRAGIAPLRDKMTAMAWEALQQTCLKVAGLFPDCHYVALDVAVDISLQYHVVLEVNAFGDFVKDVWHRGLSPYACEIQALQERWQRSGSVQHDEK